MKLIKVESRPAEQPPVAKPPEFDLKVAEAAGFHRAINIWNKMNFGSEFQAKQELRDQATELSKILSGYKIDEPSTSTLPGKFKDGSAVDGPYQLLVTGRRTKDFLLASNYYNVYWGMRHQ